MITLDLYASREDFNARAEADGVACRLGEWQAEALIVGVRKWSWDDIPGHPLEGHPIMGRALLHLDEHIRVSDKYDLFLYA